MQQLILRLLRFAGTAAAKSGFSGLVSPHLEDFKRSERPLWAEHDCILGRIKPSS